MSSYTGLSPKQPNIYVGPNVYICSIVNRNREPTGADYRQPETGKLYPTGSYWLIGGNPTTGVFGDLWYLSKIVANVAYWLKLSSGGSGTLLAIEVDAVTAPGVNPVTPIVGIITFHGDVVSNHSVPVETRSRALNVMNLEVQYATSAAATDGTKSGLAHFNSSMFTVDASGFVSLAGGGLAIDQINVDANTAPGTDPVVADATGQITVTGAQVAAGTIGANAIRTDSLAVNTYTIEVQRAAAAASSSVNNNGISSYNSTDFTVDANGYVSLISTLLNPITNLGITYSGNTFTICGYNGAALSASNPARVWIQSSSAPGKLILYTITANQTFTDGAAGSVTTQRFGLTAAVNASVDIPFFIYAVPNAAETSVAFMIARTSGNLASPVAGSIGKSGALVNVGQSDFYSLASVTVADYASKPVKYLGWFRMQFTGATNSWTVSALSSLDGIGQFPTGYNFVMPRGQFGAAAGKYFADNGGTAPDSSTSVYNYQLTQERTCNIQFYNQPIDTAGLGAVYATLAIPFSAASGVAMGGGYWVGGGGSPGSNHCIVLGIGLTTATFVINTFVALGWVQSAGLLNSEMGLTAVLIGSTSYFIA